MFLSEFSVAFVAGVSLESVRSFGLSSIITDHTSFPSSVLMCSFPCATNINIINLCQLWKFSFLGDAIELSSISIVSL